ncbi:MAG: ArnT family glycosyltransferase [Chthonomonadales bacterium]
MKSPRWLSEAALWCGLAVLCYTAYFWRLGGVGILDLDEGLYAECAREMAGTGDWVTPRVNGSPFFEKPPLAYWAAGACFRLFGRSEFTARLPAAVASGLVVGLVFWFGRREFGVGTGWLAAALFATAPLVVGEARQLTTDALLDLCVCTALMLGYESLGARPGTQFVLATLAWAACGAGVLAKGAPGILLPALVAGAYLLWLQRTGSWGARKLLSARVVLAGIAVFLLIAAPWHIAAYRANGGSFFEEYIIRQHVGRFQGGDTAHRAPVWFYVPAFLLGAFPWSFGVAAAALGALRAKGALRGTQPGDVRQPVRAFLWIWIVVVFVAFSAGGSKLVSYILPLYPAAALLAADGLMQQLRPNGRMAAIAVWLGLAAVTALAVLLLVMRRSWVLSMAGAVTHRREVLTTPEQALLHAAILPLAVMAAGPFFASVAAVTKLRRLVAPVLVGFMAAFPVAAVAWFMPVLSRQVVDPAHVAAHTAGAEAVRLGYPLALCLGRPRRPSVFFYLPKGLLPYSRGHGSRVLEAQEAGQVRLFAAQHHGCIVMASAGCAQELAGILGRRITEAERVGEWRILRVSEP